MTIKKHTLSYILVSVLTYLAGTFLFSCATPKPPTGGKQDKKPPTLIRTSPKSKSTNFSSSRIELEFTDKHKIKNKNGKEITDPMYGTNIKIHDFDRNVIISPRTDVKLKPRVKGMILQIDIEGSFKPNTTYTISFPNVVSDNTENNKINQFNYVFSTGSFLDTANISGNVKTANSNTPVKEATVLLYPVSDTIDITKHKPDYFAVTNSTGTYHLENLTPGTYQSYVINDKNGNLLLDKDEDVAFLDNPLTLDTLLKEINFRTFLNDNDPPAIDFAEYKYNVLIRFNEPVEHLKILDPDGKEIKLPMIADQSKTQFSFFKSFDQDSLELQILYADANNNNDTSNYIIYKPKFYKKAVESIDCQLLNKTILGTDTLKFHLIYKLSRIEPSGIHILKDSVEIANVANNQYNITNDELHLYINNMEPGSQITVRMDSAALYGLDTNLINNDTMNHTFTIADPAKLSSMSGSINYAGSIYQLELVKEGKIVRTTTNKTFRFTNLEPGEYSIRIKLDENNNGRYDPGDLELKRQPEKIFFHTTPIKLLPNWEIQDVIIDVKE